MSSRERSFWYWASALSRLPLERYFWAWAFMPEDFSNSDSPHSMQTGSRLASSPRAAGLGSAAKQNHELSSPAVALLSKKLPLYELSRLSVQLFARVPER